MSREEETSIVFSLKEAVWFNRGNEVEELYSLALEPDVSIHEEDDYVFIRGNLHLFGEYRPNEDDMSNSEERGPDQTAFRTVDEVIMNDNGVGMLRHSFPMDVTIPKERVARLEDIYVTVDSLDYDLPEKEYLELQAQISIAGIREETGDENVLQESVESTSVEDQVSEESSSLLEENESHEREFHIEQYKSRDLEEVEEDEESESSSFIEDEIIYAGDDGEDHHEDQLLDREEERYDDEDEDEDDNDDEVGIEIEENALYLTKMLTKGEEEFSKLKMCIVQAGESLETISKRYEIQVSQLIRVNRLSEEQVSEGQILYIPADRPKKL